MKKKIEELKQKREMAKELYIKCQGAIEVLEEIEKEKDEKEKSNKKV